MTSIATVNNIRCRSSGILKIFVNAEIMEANDSDLAANNYRSSDLFNSLPCGIAEFIGFDRQLFGEFTAPQNLQAVKSSVNEPFFAQELLSHSLTLFESFEVTQVHEGVGGLELRIVESPLWQPPDQRHLTPFEPKPDTPP